MFEINNLKRKGSGVDPSVILDISARSGAIVDALGHVITNAGVTSSTAVMHNGNPSMYFNGLQYFSVPNTNSSLWLPGTFCIDFWFYLISKKAKFPSFFGNYDSWPNSNGMQLFAGHDGSNSNAFLGAIAGEFPTLNNVVATIPYGSWHHYAVERNSGNVIINYLDGVAKGTKSTAAALYGSKSKIVFGAPSDDPSGGINGYLDRIRITSGTRFNGPFTPPTF